LKSRCLEKRDFMLIAQIGVVRVFLKFLGMFIKAYLKSSACLTHVDSVTVRGAPGKLVGGGGFLLLYYC